MPRQPTKCTFFEAMFN